MREEYEEVTGDASNLYTEEEEVGEGGEEEADRALQSVMTSRSTGKTSNPWGYFLEMALTEREREKKKEREREQKSLESKASQGCF